MTLSDLIKIFLPEASDQPEPTLVTKDPETGLSRPCESIEKILHSTQETNQEYMSSSGVKRQIHCVSQVTDKVGPSGIKIEIDRDRD